MASWDIYRLTKSRERKTSDLNQVRFMKFRGDVEIVCNLVICDLIVFLFFKFLYYIGRSTLS